MLPKITIYTKRFDETKYIFFLIKDDKLKEKYNNIWNKVSNSIRKWFDSETVYHEKYLKTKTKPYEGKINTNFHNNGIPKEGLHHISLSVILIDSVSKIGKIVFLEKCKCNVKEKMDNVDDDLWGLWVMT